MVTYQSTYEYINTPAELSVKIARLKNIINAYSETLLAGATTGNILEYSLDDGQSKIKTVYRGATDLANSIQGLEKLLEIYIVRYNKLKNGSITRLSDSKNFRP